MRRPSSVHQVVLASVLVASSMGCGGSDVPPATAASVAAQPVPKEVAATRILFIATTAPQVNDAVRGALVAAGYNIATGAGAAPANPMEAMLARTGGGGRAPHDLVATLTGTFAAEQSAFAVEVNGVRKTSIRFNVTLTVTSASDKRVVDTVSTQFVAAQDEVTAEKVKPLVDALTASGKVSTFARELQDKQAAEAKAKADAEAQAKADKEAAERRRADEKKEAEEAAWRASGSEECAAPTAPDSCKKLVAWLKATPKNPHVAEGDDIVKKSASKIAELAEAASWRDAGLDKCKAPKTGDDCLGVEVYVGSFPNGPHAAEAKDVIAKSAGKIAALQKAEADKAAAEKKKQDREECKEDCKANRCAMYALSNKFDLCMSRCVRNICGQ